jgi:hypothetical protein
MAKNAITDYSTTAADNTDVGGIGIQGTNAISNIDNAAREIMSQLADTNAGTAPFSDTLTIGDAADLTKELRFELSAITAGQTRVITVPDANITLPSSFATLNSLEGLTLGAGDMLYATAADTLTDLAIGTAGQFLVTNAGATAPEWASRPTLVSLEGLTLGAGDIVYATAADTLADLAIGTAGQSLIVNAGATAPSWGSSIVSGTVQASTSGTSIDFTSIPSWVKKITIMFVGVSTSGTSNPLFQIGDSGGIEATGYLGTSGLVTDTGSDAVNYTTGFGLDAGTAAGVTHGAIVLSLVNAATFTWAASGFFGQSNARVALDTAGSKSLTATLDRVRITTVGGADTFDAGSINILYE